MNVLMASRSEQDGGKKVNNHKNAWAKHDMIVASEYIDVCPRRLVLTARCV